MTNKPAPQIAGVVGIGAVPIYYEPKQSLDWKKIVSLPPFQMFAAERVRNRAGADAVSHAELVVHAAGGSVDLYDAYCAWHRDKGYWSNETPMGETKDAT